MGTSRGEIPFAPFPRFPTDLLGVVVFLTALVFLWIVVSVPVYFAGRAVKGGSVAFGDAMRATLGGGVAYFLVYLIVAFFLGAVIGAPGVIAAALFGLLAWLAVFRAAFRTGWGGAVAIVVVAWLLLLALDFVFVALVGVRFPNFLPF